MKNLLLTLTALGTVMLSTISEVGAQQTPARPAATPSASTTAPNPFTDAIRAEVGQTLEQLLLNRPDVIADAVFRDRENMRRERQAISLQTLRIARLEAMIDGTTIATGPAEGKSAIVIESFECQPCRSLHAELDKRASTGWRISYRYVPIARDNGILALQALHAAAAAGKGREMQKALHAIDSDLDEGKIAQAISGIGIERDTLVRTLQDRKTELAIAREIQTTFLLGVRRAPIVILEGQQVLEAPTPEALRSAMTTIEEAAIQSEQQRKAQEAAQAPNASPAPTTPPAGASNPGTPRNGTPSAPAQQATPPRR